MVKIPTRIYCLDPPLCGSLIPNEKQILTGSEFGTIQLWDLNNKLLLKTYQFENCGTLPRSFSPKIDDITAIALTPDAKFAFVGTKSGQVMQFSLENWSKVPRQQEYLHNGTLPPSNLLLD